MRKITAFNIKRYHIYTAASIVDHHDVTHAFRGIVDCAAPTTEFSDRFLRTIGLLTQEQIQNVAVPSEQQTKKYARMTLPKIQCLGQVMENVTIKISKFAEGWGIDALIGLDFFRQFRTTIDYSEGIVITEPYEKKSKVA